MNTSIASVKKEPFFINSLIDEIIEEFNLDLTKPDDRDKCHKIHMKSIEEKHGAKFAAEIKKVYDQWMQEKDDADTYFPAKEEEPAAEEL